MNVHIYYKIYVYKLEIGCFKIVDKIIEYNINSLFHNRKVYMICYQNKVGETNFYKFINKILIYLINSMILEFFIIKKFIYLTQRL